MQITNVNEAKADKHASWNYFTYDLTHTETSSNEIGRETQDIYEAKTNCAHVRARVGERNTKYFLTLEISRQTR